MDRGISDIHLDDHEEMDAIDAAAEDYLGNPRVREMSFAALLSKTERDAHLMWLKTVDPLRQHDEARKYRTNESTGQWFLSHAFERWKERPRSFMWLAGKPAGTVVYFYFSFKQEATQTVREFKHSLLMQLVRSLVRGDDKLQDRFYVHKAFQKLYDKYSHSQFAIDEDVHATFEGLLTINNLECSKTVVLMEVAKVNADIKTFLVGSLKREPYRSWKPVLKTQVAKTLTSKADGVFRWAALQLDSLRDNDRAKDVENALQTLPKNLEETYKVMLKRIENSNRADTALSILRWLAYAQRSILLSEVAEIAVFETGRIAGSEDEDEDEDAYTVMYHPKDRSPSIWSVRKILSGLITVSGIDDRDEVSKDQDGTVSFSRFTVKEYLDENLRRLSDESDPLQAPVDDGTSCEEPDSDPDSDSESEFDFSGSESPTEQEVDFSPFPLLFRDLPTSLGWSPEGEEYMLDFEDPFALHRVAGLGNEVMVQLFLDARAIVNIGSNQHDTPLHQAVKNNHRGVVRQLVEGGAKINGKGSNYRTPLSWAAGEGLAEIATYLLDHGVEIDASDHDLRELSTRAPEILLGYRPFTVLSGWYLHLAAKPGKGWARFTGRFTAAGRIPPCF
ncbi:hypothetical protein MFIFM68171_09564 [Madurella fahalii]|uniref:Ankyrin repeat protein n=1 Tax=Madurella fahalii TaxID=1157608 RepID=A0ABQ0GNL1_9PEZI